MKVCSRALCVIRFSTANQLVETLTTGWHRRRAWGKEDRRHTTAGDWLQAARELVGTFKPPAGAAHYKAVSRAAPRKLRQPRPTVALPLPESPPWTTCQANLSELRPGTLPPLSKLGRNGMSGPSSITQTGDDSGLREEESHIGTARRA